MFIYFQKIRVTELYKSVAVFTNSCYTEKRTKD